MLAMTAGSRRVRTGFTLVAWMCLPGMLLGVASVARAQTAYPMLMSIEPVAARAGQTSEHTIHSRYDLYGAYAVSVTGQGVAAEPLLPEVKDGEKAPSITALKVRIQVAADAQPGVRDVRVATPRGISTVGQLVIVRQPVVTEQSKNNAIEQAEPVELPATLCGAIESNEDVDYFRFSVASGQTWCFHVQSMRLQDRIHDLQKHVDPILTLRNAAGSTLAASDNYFFGDPFLCHKFEDAGEYVLEIRDVRYQGNRYWQYCVEVSPEPFVTNVFPMGLQCGTEQPLSLIGANLPPEGTATVRVPADRATTLTEMQIPLGARLSNPVPVVVTPLPCTTEAGDENGTLEQAQRVELPADSPGLGINGVIETEADLDLYRFAAAKGERFSVEIVARRQQSMLDSVVRILDASGKVLAENDDLRTYKHTFADSQIENWTVPADGEYVVEIRDLHLRGGPAFVYFLKLERARPAFELYLDTDKTQLTPGTSGVLFVNVVRKNGFAGAVDLHIEGLPEGLTASCGRILPEGRDGAIILSAMDGASEPSAAPRLAFGPVRVWGTAQVESDGETVALQADAVPLQETYQPGGGRGHWPVTNHTVALGVPGDLLAVKLSTQDVVLKPGGSQRIDVEIVRADGFDKNVQLDLLFRHLNTVYADSLPKGVSIDAKNSRTLLTGTTTSGHITLQAAPDAPQSEKQLVAVMANVSLNFVMKATYVAPPLHVSVAP